jgi:hypothetical protein
MRFHAHETLLVASKSASLSRAKVFVPDLIALNFWSTTSILPAHRYHRHRQLLPAAPFHQEVSLHPEDRYKANPIRALAKIPASQRYTAIISQLPEPITFFNHLPSASKLEHKDLKRNT